MVAKVSKVSIRELKELAASVLNVIEAAGIESVRIDRQMYWTVFPADMQNMDAPQPVLGDAVDDVVNLRGEVNDADSPVHSGTYWHALHHLSGILGFLAAMDIQGGLRARS